MESHIMDILRFITMFAVYTMIKLQNLNFMDIFIPIIFILMILWSITNVAITKERFSNSFLCNLVNLLSPILVVIGYVFYIIYLIINKNFYSIPISLLIMYTWFRFAFYSLKRFKQFISRRKNNPDAKASH